MKKIFWMLLLLPLLLASCKSGPTGLLIKGDGMSLIGWAEGRSAVVLLLDEQVHFTSGSLPFVLQEWTAPQAEIEALGRTLTLLAQVEDGQPHLIVDEEEQLNRLMAAASSLRKTRLADTLAAVSGQKDVLSELSKMQRAYLFDLRGKLEETEQIDGYLTQFIEQVTRSVKRR